MPVPTGPTFSVAAKVAAHTAFKDLIDSGTNGFLKLRDSGDVLLADIQLAFPSGTVNGSTGQYSISIASDPIADASGTAAYGELCDSAGTAHLSLPVIEGVTPTNGYITINSTNIVAGGPVNLVSFVLG